MQIANGVVTKISKNPMGLNFLTLDDGTTYGFYKTKPACQEGNEVKFVFEKKGKWNNADPSTLEVLATVSVGADAGAAGNVSRQDIISYQAARKDALQYSQLLVSVGALPVPKDSAKAMAAVRSFVNQTTEEFFFEAMNLGPNEPTAVYDENAGDE